VYEETGSRRPTRLRQDALMFGRRKAKTDPHLMLAETIARHFDGATVEGNVAHLGPELDGVTVTCRVDNINQFGPVKAAALFLQLSGGAFGPGPVFASVSGYAESDVEAIVTGGCNWACAFGPVLRAGLRGIWLPESGSFPDAEQFEAKLDGRRVRVAVAALDRAMMFVQDGDPQARIAATRRRLGADPWLTRAVLASGTLPALTGDSPALVSVFVMTVAGGRTVEVKVNGTDWPGCADLYPDAGAEPEGAMVLLRELAMVTPLEPAPALTHAAPALTRTEIEGVLSALGASPPEPRQPDGWQGWRTHGGVLDQPMTHDELAHVETATGALPADYRAFLTEVAASGAGPGYGLLPPEVVRGVIPLAHAGCGVVWVMRLDGAERGQVWCDASGSDRSYARVANSFSEWYRLWLDSAVRRETFAQWNNLSCAPANVLRQLVDDQAKKKPGQRPSLVGMLPPGAITLASGNFLPKVSAMDPCHPCVALAASFGVPPEAFAPGVLSRRGSST
jgi:hypothetical protein